MTGAAGAFSRSNPNAWTNPTVAITHRKDGSDTNQAWLATNFGTAGPGTYGESDVANRNPGVADRAGGTPPTPQEIDGTEALRSSFTAAMSAPDFTFDAFSAIEQARAITPTVHDPSGSLISRSNGFSALSSPPGR